MDCLGKRHLFLELILKPLRAKHVLAPAVSAIPREPEATSAFVGMLKSLRTLRQQVLLFGKGGIHYLGQVTPEISPGWAG